MAALRKISLVLLSMSLYITLSSSQAALSDPEDHLNFGDFSDVFARHLPGWMACNFTDTPGASCYDCNTRLICKRIGGFLIPCWFPGHNYCVDGKCAATPSWECAPSTTTEPTQENSTNTEFNLDIE